MISTLLNNSTSIKYNKFNTYHEDSIGWLKYTNPVFSLQRITRERTSNVLMLVHLQKNVMKEMSNSLSNNIDETLKINEIRIPTFDMHHTTICNGNGTNRTSTTTFDIR